MKISRENENQAAQRKFAEIAEAYEILRDGTTRQLYDHARRVRATHDSSAPGDIEGDDWATTTAEGDWWYYDGDGGAGLFGSSFEGVFGFGGRMDFEEGGESYGGGSGRSGVGVEGGGGGNTGAGMRGDTFKFRASDPFELFEVHRVEVFLRFLPPGVLSDAVVEFCIKPSLWGKRDCCRNFLKLRVLLVSASRAGEFHDYYFLWPESQEESLSFSL